MFFSFSAFQDAGMYSNLIQSIFCLRILMDMSKIVNIYSHGVKQK